MCLHFFFDAILLTRALSKQWLLSYSEANCEAPTAVTRPTELLTTLWAFEGAGAGATRALQSHRSVCHAADAEAERA